MEQINLDAGYLYGIGAFETMAIEDGIPIFLERHLLRLSNAVKGLGIQNADYEKMANKTQVMDYLLKNPQKHGCLKITVSDQNLIFSVRDNNYTTEDYNRGFTVELSRVLRNETSPMTYFKTLNYADNILEKREAKKRGIDEPIFINTKGQLTEGATTNVFLVKDGRIITPKLECGLLNGIMRSYLLDNYQVSEDIILLENVEESDEMFLTNSLLGIMPVKRFGGKVFSSRLKGEALLEEYRRYIV